MTHWIAVAGLALAWAWIICVSALAGCVLLVVLLARVRAARIRRRRDAIPEPASWKHRRRAGFREHIPDGRAKAERVFFLMSGGR